MKVKSEKKHWKGWNIANKSIYKIEIFFHGMPGGMSFTPIDTSKSWSYQCCLIESCFPRLQCIDADVHSKPACEKMKFYVCLSVMLDFMVLRSKPRGKCFSWDFEGCEIVEIWELAKVLKIYNLNFFVKSWVLKKSVEFKTSIFSTLLDS